MDSLGVITKAWSMSTGTSDTLGQARSPSTSLREALLKLDEFVSLE